MMMFVGAVEQPSSAVMATMPLSQRVRPRALFDDRDKAARSWQRHGRWIDTLRRLVMMQLNIQCLGGRRVEGVVDGDRITSYCWIGARNKERR